jgi:long-chain acyl-CoA synthetase
MMTRTNVLSFLPDFAARGDRPALAHRRGLRIRRWTCARLAAESYRVARELEARHVSKGDRVIIWAENSPAWVAAFFGCLLHGAIVVPLDAASAPDFAARVQSRVNAKLLFRGEVEAGDLSGALPTLPLSELSRATARHSDAPYAAVEIGAEEIAEIIYTSGTTAEPKGVVLTHGNLCANLAPIEREIQKYIKWERLVRPLRFLCLIPLSHVFGQFMGMFVPSLLGGEVFFQESLKPSEIIETAKRQRVSVIVAVPRLLDTLREKIERDADTRGRLDDFRHQLDAAARWSVKRRWLSFRKVHRGFGWKFWAFVVGGATLDETTETFWRRLGYAVVQGYGMTETASLVSVNHPFRSARGSIGRTLPGQEIRIGAGGEIEVRGANVSPGYWDDGAVRAAGDSEGWLRTGDVAELDASGKLFFKGRGKDVIVTGAGLNIHPEDLEAALNRQPEVRASAVVGVEGARGTEALAVLVLRDAGADVEAIIGRANEGLARHQQIRRWLVWHDNDLPRTTTQKILRREVAEVVRARLAAQRSNGESGSFAPTAPSDALAEIVARVGGDIGQGKLTPAANLSTDLKLDSLGRVELLGALEDRFQVELDEAAFTNATTLGDVQRIIARGTGAGVEVDPARAPYPYPRWARRFPATWLRVALLYTVVFPLVRLMCPLRVEGRKRLARLNGRPALFVANHVTRADQALVLAALPGGYARRLAVTMDGELLRAWRHAPPGTRLIARLRGLAQYALVVTFFNVFPLPKQSGFRRSFAYAGEAVDRGYNLLVFPEGVRAKEGRMNRFMSGTGLLVKELGVPVVPLRMDGLYKLKREGRRHALPGEVTLRFGEPVEFDGEEATEIARELERRVATL